MSEGFRRKLTAIMAADVAGYSKMMAADEGATVSAVRALQHHRIAPVLEEFGGRIVKTMGDGFLIEFGSVVDSAGAAVRLQQALREDNANVPPDRQIVLRIGIHLGDVMSDGQDLLGDGVNVAARIEPLARPGGVALSDEAHRQVSGKLDVEWADGGEHELKNIPRPMRIWHWQGVAGADDALPKVELALPDKPSVAVLPFVNMSGDPEQEFFADGMTEDLITDLSKVSGLFVVARTSTFSLRGQAVDIPTVGRRLGVAHVIEGSVRKMGPRVRINVQLVDARTGGHVWADRYDGSLDEVFELQDDVCTQVVKALSVTLSPSEQERLAEVHTTNVEAYELFVQAKATPYPPVPPRIKAAADLFAKVVELEPGFAGGYTGLSWMMSLRAFFGEEDAAAIGAKAEALAYKAVAADPEFGLAHTAVSLSLLMQRQYDEAIQAAQKGLALWPNDADGHSFYGLLLTMCDRCDEALEAVDTALRLSPHFVNGPYLNLKCFLLFVAGQYERALEAFDQNVARGGPVGPPALCWVAACHQALGQPGPARKAMAELELRFPGFQMARSNSLMLFQHEVTRDRISALYTAAGVP